MHEEPHRNDTPSPLEREEGLFAATLSLPSSKRDSFLRAACSGDPLLLARVEALLSAHVKTHGLFDQPAVVFPTLAEEMAALTEKAGTRIGRYKLCERIGEGGWGVVWMAEQEEPVRRRVALKVIKLGMDTRAVIARFEAERQALAMMDHQSIARVFDAGATEAGRPYFVMELVQGRRITDFCNEQNLAVESRLRLFIDVCLAVQHAHQKGIIHRDLKPSNILVTLREGIPIPKIIDFGIVKATQERLTDKTVATAFALFMGTPAYMSPEQASLSEGAIDTRSDIYSLGVLLYELLVGRTPFDGQEMMRNGVDAMRRIICESEPALPSARLNEIVPDESILIAQSRGTKPPALIRLVQGDLDWIVMCCLEKDCSRRYATANDLAADIRRHLDNEPVLVRPPGTLYRVGKYARRHRTAVIAATMALVALTIGLVVALSGMRRAIAEQQIAEIARREAEHQRESTAAALAEAEMVTEFLTGTVGAADPAKSGREVTVRQVLDQASSVLTEKFTDRPLLKARLHETIGETYHGLGLFDKAAEHLKQCVQIRTVQLGAHDPRTLHACTTLAQVYTMTSARDESIPLARNTLAAYDNLPNAPRRDIARAHYVMSFALFIRGGAIEDAVHHARLSYEIYGNELGEHHPETLSAKQELSIRLWTAEEYEKGLTLARELKDDDTLPKDHPIRAMAIHGATMISEELGQYELSAQFAAEAVEIETRIFGEGHFQTHNARLLEACARIQLERKPDYAAIVERVLDAQDKMLPPIHPARFMAMTRAANVFASTGDYPRALTLARGGLEGLEIVTGDAPFTFRAIADLALMECRVEEYNGAENHARDLLRRLEKSGRNYRYSLSRARLALAAALMGQTRFDEAEQILLANAQTLAGLPLNVVQQRQLTATALITLYEKRGQPERATEWQTRLHELSIAL